LKGFNGCFLPSLQFPCIFYDACCSLQFESHEYISKQESTQFMHVYFHPFPIATNKWRKKVVLMFSDMNQLWFHFFFFFSPYKIAFDVGERKEKFRVLLKASRFKSQLKKFFVSRVSRKQQTTNIDVFFFSSLIFAGPQMTLAVR
jgi:hypothetical protein